ncbi:hypothetical protein ACFW2V_12755 [Streptomyces sp. NPDC058947]|uniref:hypothetical protein n=1 Tax=Streptomyces sp. NPDC058947 TaxID=3346675 RepID=UPI0036CBB6D3
MNLAIVQQQQLEVPETSWLGHTTMAGFGIVILVLSAWCIKGNKKGVAMGLWGPRFGFLMNKAITEPTKRMGTKVGGGEEGFDWRSLMTFLIGMTGMTAILSSTGGFVVNLVGFFQGLVLKAADWPVIADLGAGGICLLMGFLAMRNKNDDMADLAYGAVCGFFFPLGGGMFAQLTMNVGHWIPQLMNIG